ncbi:MAG: hypothetical protein JO306_11055 [Gemmatimonadetes bacterium]|nr:hypothetical protein [Gemmatimonadota bacterium]
MKAVALLLVAGLVIPAASCDRAPTAARNGTPAAGSIRKTGTANASVVAAVRLSSGYTLGVVASNNGSSVTTGTAVAYSATGGVAFSVAINCISKSGGLAKLSGTVNKSSDATIVGDDAFFEVQDGTPDMANTINLASSGTGPTCQDSPEYDLATISSGTVIVN